MAVELAENSRAFVAALNRRDLDGVADVYAYDAQLVEPLAGLVEGRQQIASFWRAGLDAGIRDAMFVAQYVAQRDDYAYEVGRYTLRLADSDDDARGQVVDRGFYVLIHRRDHEAMWHFLLHVMSPDEPLSDGRE